VLVSYGVVRCNVQWCDVMRCDIDVIVCVHAALYTYASCRAWLHKRLQMPALHNYIVGTVASGSNHTIMTHACAAISLANHRHTSARPPSSPHKRARPPTIAEGEGRGGRSIFPGIITGCPPTTPTFLWILFSYPCSCCTLWIWRISTWPPSRSSLTSGGLA